jgi:hypothetical protein
VADEGRGLLSGQQSRPKINDMDSMPFCGLILQAAEATLHWDKIPCSCNISLPTCRQQLSIPVSSYRSHFSPLSNPNSFRVSSLGKRSCDQLVWKRLRHIFVALLLPRCHQFQAVTCDSKNFSIATSIFSLLLPFPPTSTASSSTISSSLHISSFAGCLICINRY